MNEARPQPPGDLIRIKHGNVHYAVDGNNDGERVILVAGLVTPLFAWEFLSEDLANAGYRVMRYDHFGRGFSDCPQTEYNLELYLDQLDGLLSALNIDESVNLVGWSMGGAICSAFAHRYPEKVNKLVLIAPGLFMQMPLSIRLLLKSPLFSWYMKKNGEKILLKELRKHFNKPERFPEYFLKVREQMRNSGVIESIISTMINYPLNFGTAMEALGRHPRPVLIVWGDDDEITPFENSQKVNELFRNSELFTVENAGHAPHYEYRKLVNDKIVKFLKRKS